MAVALLVHPLACQHAEGPVPGGGPVIVENADGGVIFPSTDAAVRDDGGVIMSFDAG